MRRQRVLWGAAIAAAVFLAAARPATAQDWTGRGRLVVQVQNQDQEPVKGAQIFLRFASEQTVSPDKDFTTDKKGRFSYLGLKGGTWIMRVEAEGYYPWEETVDVYSQGMPETVHVNLEPLPKEVKRAQALVEAGEQYEEAQAFAERGEYEKARAEYEKVLETLEPQDRPTVLVALAATYMEEGRLEEAEEVLRQSLEIEPGHLGSLRTLCAVVAAQGRMAEAEELLGRIPEDEPVHPTTLINIAMTHYNAGEPDRAKPLLDRVIRESPDVAIAHYYRGLVELSLGSSEAARTDLERFLELEPNHPEAANAKEYLSYLQGGAQQ